MPPSSFVACCSLMMMPSVTLLITALANKDIDGRSSWLAGTRMRQLGGWSFAFYLIHLQVLGVLAAIAHPNSMGEALAVGLVAVIISTMGAGLIHHFFEEPLERILRRRLAPRRE